MRRAVFVALLTFMFGSNRMAYPAQAPPPQDRRPARDCGNSTVSEFSVKLAPKAEAFLGALKDAVKSQDKRRIAAMVHYPLSINSPTGRRQVKTSAQLIANFDRLFPTSIRKAINQQTKECLFANWQGVMIGDGEVWFEEEPNGAMKIITLNIP